MAAALALLGLLLNLYRIDNQSLWTDESFSVLVSSMPVREMVGALIRSIANPPFYPYLLHLWFGLFGAGGLQARLFSALFATLSILVIYFLGRYLFGDRVGLLSGLILAVSQLNVMYAQEARTYSLLLFLLLCSVFLLLVAVRERRAWAWWGFVIVQLCALYSHYYAAAFLIWMWLYALVRRRRHGIKISWLIGGLALSCALLAPWLASGVIHYALASPLTKAGRREWYFSAHWWTYFSVQNRFANGKFFGVYGPSPWWTYVASGVVFLLPAVWAVVCAIRGASARIAATWEEESTLFLATLWIMPVVMLVTWDLIGFDFDIRYVSYCLGPFCLVLARGLSQLSGAKLRGALTAGIVTLALLSLRSVYFIPYKEDYRGALTHLSSEYRQGDCAIFMPFHNLPDQWSIYRLQPQKLPVVSLDAVLSGRAACSRVWLVTYERTEGATQRGVRGKQALESMFSKVEERGYFWVDVGLYIPKKTEYSASSSTTK